MITADLTINPKQAEFLNTVLTSTVKKEHIYIAYGGAVRGGKTFVALTTLILLAKKYPNSRWVVVREDMPALITTTVPSILKIIGASDKWKWNRDKSNYYAQYSNGSRIIFKGENISSDPELLSYLGLECNGFLLEQAEELSEKTWEKALERSGSWYLNPMPPPFIFLTFNPTQNWVKRKFYEPWTKGELTPPYHFISALPKDNPFVTKEQWSAWGLMAERYQRQFIEGDWTEFDSGGRWAFAFDERKHSHGKRPELNRNEIVYLSFDFNRNPICCQVIQHYDSCVKGIESIKLPNSDIYALCDYILVHYSNCLFMATGDASGSSSSALVQDNLNYYTVIRQKLSLSGTQLQVPTVNPKLHKNQLLTNSILANYNCEFHEEKCAGLIFDFKYVKMLADGTIEKRDRTDPTQQADSLDCFRYFCNTFMGDFIKIQ